MMNVDFKFDKDGQSFVIPEGCTVYVENFETSEYARRWLRAPGLYDDDLVCVEAEDQSVEPGDVGASCAECGTAVAVRQGDIELFGRDPRPRILCRECGAPEMMDYTWSPVTVPSIDFASWTTGTNFWKTYKDPVTLIQEVVDTEGGTTCRECGAFVKKRGGQKVCKSCQRRAWRRR